MHQLDDLGNAQNFIEHSGEQLRYVPQWGWLFWNGQYWQRDTSGAILEQAKMVIHRIRAEAEELPDKEAALRTQMLTHARRSSSAGRLQTMVNLASSASCILATPELFDRDPRKLNVKNGTVDLYSGTRNAHNPNDYITHYIPIDYNPEAQSGDWRNFLNDITNHDKALQDYLQRAVGYSLTAQTNEEVLFLLCGPGRNGKSKFLEALGNILGDYVQYAPTRLFMRGNRPPSAKALATLGRAHMVITTETDATQTLDMTLLKRLTSGEAIASDASGETPVHPHCKLWFATNQLPQVSEQTVAAWQRIRLIPFPVSFIGKEDKYLSVRLKNDAPAILAWAIQGAYLWLHEGLREPDCVKEALLAYQDEQDELASFLRTCCEFSPSRHIKARDLYATYQLWCESTNITPISETTFGRQLTQKSYQRKHTNEGQTYIGLAIKQAKK